MKKLKYSLSILMAIIMFSCGGEISKDVAVEKADMNLVVEGMVCAVGCAKGIEEHMSELEGIFSCVVDFETKEAHIEFDKSKMSEKEITTTIENLNDQQYKVTLLQPEKEVDVEEVETSKSEAETDPVSVYERSFTIPNLITYFLSNY